MQVCWRRVAPGEIDHELLWLSISVAGPGAAAIWLAFGLPWPHCLFLSITGHPCVTCGATRSAIQFFHGHLLAAWRWNPLIFAFFCGLTIFDIYAAVVLVTGAPRLRIQSLSATEKKWARILILALLGLNWIYLLVMWEGRPL
jgi:hypothetical protein